MTAASSARPRGSSDSSYKPWSLKDWVPLPPSLLSAGGRLLVELSGISGMYISLCIDCIWWDKRIVRMDPFISDIVRLVSSAQMFCLSVSTSRLDRLF